MPTTFFTELKERVEALERFSSPHPLSTAVAVMRLKSYLAEYTHRIRLKDLVDAEVGRVLTATSTPQFAVKAGPIPNSKNVQDRLRAYQAVCETLVEMAVVGGYWVEDWHHDIWQRALIRLATKREPDGPDVWVGLQPYPATLLLYALGLGAVEAGERGLLFLGQLFGTPIHKEQHEEKTAVELLPPFCLLEPDSTRQLLAGTETSFAPLNDWLHVQLRQGTCRLLTLEHSRFTFAFDRLEVLLALCYANTTRGKYTDRGFWLLCGSYVNRHDNCDRIVREIRAALDSQGDRSPYVTSGIFGSSAVECGATLSAFENRAQKLHSELR